MIGLNEREVRYEVQIQRLLRRWLSMVRASPSDVAQCHDEENGRQRHQDDIQH
jgi:hypothetical protein